MRLRTALAVLLVYSGHAGAQVRLGPEFQAYTFTTGKQQNSRVAADAAGEFVVVWESAAVDGSEYAVLARRYDASGAPLGGSEFRVNVYTTSVQNRVAVASDPDGGLVVVWHSFGQDGAQGGLFGRRFDASGASVGGEFQINTYTPGQQRRPRVGTAADGRFVIVWTDYALDGAMQGVFGQRYDASGAALGPEFRVNSYTTSTQFLPRVSVAPDGRFVVAWVSFAQDGSDAGVFAQRYDSSGAAAGPEIQVNTYTTGFQQGAAVAVRADGSFVVAWNSVGQDGSLEAVMGRRFNDAGAPLGGEFRVSQYTTGSQYNPDVALDPDGNFLVAWTSEGQDGSTLGAFGRWFDASGAPQGDEFAINSYTTGKQTFPEIASQGAGNFVVTYFSEGQDGSDYGVFGQRFGPDLIFRDGFESNSLSNWSNAATDGGDLSVSTDAAMALTGLGMRVLVDDTAGVFVQDDRPADEDRYRARFYFDPNGFDPGETLGHRRTRLFIAFEEAPTRRLAAVVLRRLSGAYALMLRCRLDDDSQDDSGFFPISDGPHFVEIDWKRSSGPDAADGSCQLSIDGTPMSERTGLDNSVSRIDFVRLGALSVKTGAAGAMHWDEFVSRRLNPIGP